MKTAIKHLDKTKNGKTSLVNKILFLETNSEYYSFFRNMYLTLGKFCNTLLYFNRRDNYFKYGKERMNKMLLELIKKEKPDYIFTWLTWDEFYIDTLLRINKLSPKTKTVVIFGDDTIQFYDFSQYYAYLFNYVFTTLKSYQKKYKKNGIKNVFFTSLTDTDNFHPVKTEKKYDVTFIGSQKMDKSGRYDYVKYLKNKGINIRVFGFGWENYPDLKEIYGGSLGSEEIVNVINQSKINLCFSKDNFGRPQMKAKIFEVAACNSFCLCEHAKDYLDYFTNGRNIVLFKSKEDLFEKINYYFKNKSKREKIALESYKHVRKNYALYNELKSFILKTRHQRQFLKLPKIKGSIFCITEKEIDSGIERLKKILSGHKYISFKTSYAEHLHHKEFFQAFSLEKSKKEISCCNYYVHSKVLGDYLLFFVRDGLGLLSKEDCNTLFDVNQIMVTKEYFIRNYEALRSAFHGRKIDFIDKETTSFVAIPLLRIKNLKTKNYEILKKAFGFKFIYHLYSLAHQKKIFFSPYTFSFILEIILGKTFLYKALADYLKDKNIWAKFKRLS